MSVRGATFQGRPCPQCGGVLRYVNSPQCVECSRRRGLARYRREPHVINAQATRWRQQNPDRMKALQARASAEKRWPGCVSADFDLEATVPIYADARRLTLETGALHHVDHVVPLGRGGKHEAANLQVLNAIANMLKGPNLEKKVEKIFVSTHRERF